MHAIGEVECATQPLLLLVPLTFQFYLVLYLYYYQLSVNFCFFIRVQLGITVSSRLFFTQYFFYL